MTRPGSFSAHLADGLLILTLMFSGAMFGFFFAWTSSTLWGLDNAPPDVAITAMQAMNSAVRNPVFGLAFFGTPSLMVLTIAVLFLQGARPAALFMLLASLIYLGGVLIVTVGVNVPMNEALAALVPGAGGSAAHQWEDYSEPWQHANLVRTCASGGALFLAAMALHVSHRGRPRWT
jgi:uncharacterized membrane protein